MNSLYARTMIISLGLGLSLNSSLLSADPTEKEKK